MFITIKYQTIIVKIKIKNQRPNINIWKPREVLLLMGVDSIVRICKQ
jgi:hypothetical protein